MTLGQKVSPHHRGRRNTHFLVRTSTIFGADVHDPKGFWKTLYKKSLGLIFWPLKIRNVLVIVNRLLRWGRSFCLRLGLLYLRVVFSFFFVGRKSTRKIHRKWKSSSQQVFLNNFHWAPDSCHREECKSLRKRFDKVRVNVLPFFCWYFGIWGGLLGL